MRASFMALTVLGVTLLSCSGPRESTSTPASNASAASAAPGTSEAPAAILVAVRYRCEGGRTFEAYPLREPDRYRVILDGRTVDLPHVRSDGRFRYTDGSTTFAPGKDAYIEERGTLTYATCQQLVGPPMPPPPLPAAP
jgi:membrane-bound inhibitor of C-type lysozyme